MQQGHSGSAIGADDASSIISSSSTFSLGEPVANKSVVDSDAEEEFSNIVEGMKSTGLNERPSPVKRPSNPHLSAEGQRKADHPVLESSSEPQSASVTPTPSKSTGAAPELSLKSCLFCNYESPTVALSATHMERIHGMFIPEKQYLIDLEGLLGSLQKRIQEFNECIFCEKVKSNAFAVQTHMRDIAHCKIPYTTEADQLEIGEFYDFRSTYSDDEEEDSDDDESTANGGARLGNKRATTTTNEDGDEVGGPDEDGWETDSSASSLDSEDLHAVPMEHHYHQYERLDKHPHHSHTDSRPHHHRDGWHSHIHKPTRAAFYDDYELHLPSGRSVGHRSLNRYFRQNLHNYPSAVERAEAEEQAQLALENGDAMDVDDEDGEGTNNQVAQQPRGRGRDQNRSIINRANAGMLGVSDKKKKEVKRAEQRGRTFENVRNRRNQWSLNKSGNNQKYYNYQIL